MDRWNPSSWKTRTRLSCISIHGFSLCCLAISSHGIGLVIHYIDVIMTTVVSQITSLMVVYSIVYSDADQRKHQSSASLAIVRGIHRTGTGEFPAQMASNAENVSFWWRHHVRIITDSAPTLLMNWGRCDGIVAILKTMFSNAFLLKETFTWSMLLKFLGF